MSLARHLSVCFVVMTGVASALAEQPNFGRDVRPILAKHCFACHGPDPEARESDLRLDQQQSAHEDRGGYAVIAPGKPNDSELIARVTSDDVDARMPPGDAHPPLSEDETATLKKWIKAGGRYEQHWAFVPPIRPDVPAGDTRFPCSGPIDQFVLRRMTDAGLKPSPRADKATLIRRLYIDLTGTTPPIEAVDRFVADTHPTAYARLVDRLLATEDYAERFARPWLDLARYSDTNGYEKDRERTIWPFRDWVIQAIAADMPYDQFSIEQLAGDMLPGATNQQRIATGFHRNTMINEEGGIDPLEYRFYAIVDRVATTGTAWLGLTTGCAQCHTHKYDPITHTDYFALFALMNQTDEPDVVVEDHQHRRHVNQLRSQIARQAGQLIDKWLPGRQTLVDEKLEDPIHDEFASWLREQMQASRHWQTIRPTEMKSTMPKLKLQRDGSILATGDVTKRDVYTLKFSLPAELKSIRSLRLEVLPHDLLPDGGPGLAFYEGRRGDFFLSHLQVSTGGKQIALENASHNYGKISVGSGKADPANVLDDDGSTGWSTSGREGQASQLVVNFAKPLETSQEIEIQLLFERHFAAALGRFRFAVCRDNAKASELPFELYDWQASKIGEIEPTDFENLQRHFLRVSDSLAVQRRVIERLEKSIPKPIRTLGLRERSTSDRRTTHRHHRGEYLNPKEEVAPAVPSLFPPMDSDQVDRLGLARWLVSERNPLVARVTVNRAWREFFGSGIVNTAGDFGTQSEPPSHPNLIDWLAVDLMNEGNWSLKRLHREIVLSDTYQQKIAAPLEAEPRNRLLSRFPHRRFDAERVRDVLLSASGLLARSVGGPSVYPPQPDSAVTMAYNTKSWASSTGADRYRRSLYTFSKRTAPFAAFTTFDAPSGEICIARRDRSTTPLQALTLLNDEMFLEIARGLADSTQREIGESASAPEIAIRLFRRLLVRQPADEEVKAIMSFYRSIKDHEEPWTLVARALINADEAITTP